MSTTTVPVTLTAADQNGNAVAGARIKATLDATEVYQGFVVPETVETFADAAGRAVLQLWPNALGVAGSRYRVQAWNPDTGKRFLDAIALVPNNACNLHEILVQEPYPVDAGTEKPIRTLFSKTVGTCDGVIITGTRAPGYTKTLYADFVREAKQLGKFVLLDLKGDDLLSCLPYRPDVIKPNLSEAAHTFLDLQVGEQEDTQGLERRIRPILEDLQRRYGTTVVLSRGKRDTWVQGPSFFTVAVKQVEVVNPIGCGDALGAALTRELIMGTNLQQAVQHATNVATMNAKTIHPGSIV